MARLDDATQGQVAESARRTLAKANQNIAGALTGVAKEATLAAAKASIEGKIDGIDLAAVAKEATLATAKASIEGKIDDVSDKLDNLDVSSSLSGVAQESTLSDTTNGLAAIKAAVGQVKTAVDGISTNGVSATVDLTSVTDELSDTGHGLAAIKNAVDGVAGNVDMSAVAKTSDVSAAKDSIESKLDDSTNGLAAIKTAISQVNASGGNSGSDASSEMITSMYHRYALEETSKEILSTVRRTASVISNVATINGVNVVLPSEGEANLNIRVTADLGNILVTDARPFGTAIIKITDKTAEQNLLSTRQYTVTGACSFLVPVVAGHQYEVQWISSGTYLCKNSSDEYAPSMTSTVTAPANGSILEVQCPYYSMPADGNVSFLLCDLTPDKIAEYIQSNIGPSLWDIGDCTAPVTLNGTVGTLALTGVQVRFKILGINHNANVESGGLPNVHFGLTHYVQNTDICFGDGSNYKTNAGGWKTSALRTDACSEFYGCLPQEWRTVITDCHKWTDNESTSTSNNALSETADKIWIPSEWEVFGSRTFATTEEPTKQAQYEYYASGNSKIRYRHDLSNRGYWFLRSKRAEDQSIVSSVDISGMVHATGITYQSDLVPCFQIS